VRGPLRASVSDMGNAEPELPAAVARAPHHEKQRLVEQPAEGAEESVVACEKLVSPAWCDVARENYCVRSFLLLAPVDDIEEQVGA
jgi:hypothetical protein